MRRTLAVVFAVVAVASVAFACGFQSSRISWQRFYRAEGWQLPGVSAGELAPSDKKASIPGLTARALRLDAPGIVEFPSTEFNLDGQRRQMPAQTMRASLTRWELEGSGKVVAYSYDLVPIDARREGSKWVTGSIAQCTFEVTFIDDKGDGVFRLMLTEPMRAELMPDWTKRPKS